MSTDRLDRARSLRSARRLLKEGKLTEAIDQCLGVMESVPGDWSAATLLGNLYLRTGRTGEAATLFIRMAVRLKDEGFMSRANAFYNRALDLKPDDEHAVLTLGDEESATLPAVAADLDGVFAQFREDAARRLAIDGADLDYDRGVALYAAGQLDAAVTALEAASRAPRLRFEAASALATIHLETGQTWQAIEWLERAAQAPATTPDAGHWLLLRLADALESVGEGARSLAICLELRSLAGDYDDVAQRIARLGGIQAKG